MRLLGHPVHVMLVHFPIALWPAHAAAHLFAHRLPADVAGAAGFWLLAGGVVLGWLALLCGAADLLELWRTQKQRELSAGLVHAGINSTVLFAFTGLLVLEYPDYPGITHGTATLAGEIGFLVAMSVGNYFGGKIVWGEPSTPPSS